VGPDQHRHEDNFALCSSITDLEQDLRFCLRSTPMIINLVGEWGTSPPIPGPVGGSTRQKLKIEKGTKSKQLSATVNNPEPTTPV
jgi:hypothetical protein